VIEEAVTTLAPTTGTAAACRVLGVSRASHYRRRRERAAGDHPGRRPPARALTERERQTVRATLHSERFRDAAPAQVYATLLDEGTYLCSERTMYRLLAEAGEVRERRNQAQHPRYARPELLAERPNQVWSWDITKLLGPAKWT
jgi:putative transposase